MMISILLTTVQVSSYITPPHQLRVKMRPGKSHEDLFEAELRDGGVGRTAHAV